jgi:hypothetical protein
MSSAFLAGLVQNSAEGGRYCLMVSRCRGKRARYLVPVMDDSVLDCILAGAGNIRKA